MTFQQILNLTLSGSWFFGFCFFSANVITFDLEAKIYVKIYIILIYAFKI